MAIKDIPLNPVYVNHPTHNRDWWLRWLKAYKHEVHSDGTVSILGQINRLPDEKHLRPFVGKERKEREQNAIVQFKNKNIFTDFPFKFKKIVGTLDISDSGITSLEYAPEIVTGNFYCYGIKLKNGLQNSPNVGGSFNCSQCDLHSLEGSPEIIPKEFICTDNRIKNLENGPKEVGSMNISFNYRLESLKGSPRIKPFDNKPYFNFQYCSGLKTLENLPVSENIIYGYEGTRFTKEDIEEAKRVGTVGSHSSKKAKELFGGLF